MEAIIDEIGISRFIEYAADICAEKAWHVQAVWADEDLSIEWMTISNSLTKTLTVIK